MRRSYLVLLLVFSFGAILSARAQDDESPSLGDVARQARLAKQQKEAQPGTAVSAPATNGEPAAADSSNGSSQSATAPAPVKSASGAQNKAENSPTATTKNVQNGKSKKVLTNEDVGAEHPYGDSASASKPGSSDSASSDQADEKNPPDYWTTKILAQKNAIASLKHDIDELNASIQYAPGNCVSGCVEWNQNQQQKQQQVDSMKTQLEEQQKQLEEMQESARKQGYGSTVYDP